MPINSRTTWWPDRLRRSVPLHTGQCSMGAGAALFSVARTTLAQRSGGLVFITLMTAALMTIAGCTNSEAEQSSAPEAPSADSTGTSTDGSSTDSDQRGSDQTKSESNDATASADDVFQADSETTASGTADSDEISDDNAVADAWSVNQSLAKTLNLGAVFEVARYDTWALDFELAHLDAIADQGFTAIRLPVRWADWASRLPPYEIEESFFAEIDRVIERALANNLAVVLDVHHYEELDADPAGERDRFLGLWSQIAHRYRDLPNSVVFELTNEPHDQLRRDRLNEILRDAIEVIRDSNPNRTLMVGPGDWYSPLELGALVIPDDNVIVSIHYYEPFQFTHQGAEWVEGATEWIGTDFDEANEVPFIECEFADIAVWATANDVPIFVGEFGSLVEADADDRAAWTKLIRQQSERYGFSWGYWDWASSPFGLYAIEPGRPDGGTWNSELLAALLGTP